MIYTNEMIKIKKDKRIRYKKIINYAILPIFIAMLLISLYICYQRYIAKRYNIDIFGFSIYTVMTGSMEPNYNIGDFIISKKTNRQQIQIGDVITYALDDQHTVTHRIINIKSDGEILYQTKGDNNNSPDAELVKYDQIQGKVVLRIPQMGKFVTNFISGFGIIIILIVVAIFYIHSNQSEERRIAREDARRRFNVPKYNEERNI